MCGRRRAHEVYNKSVRCPQGAKSELHSHIRCSPERFKNKLSVPLNHQSSCSTLAFGVSWFELGDTAEKVLSTQRVSCCLMKAKRRKYTWSRSMNLGLRLCLGLQQSQVAGGGLKSASFPFSAIRRLHVNFSPFLLLLLLTFLESTRACRLLSIRKVALHPHKMGKATEDFQRSVSCDCDSDYICLYFQPSFCVPLSQERHIRYHRPSCAWSSFRPSM